MTASSLSLVVAATALALCAATVPAASAETITTIVRYGDLNLAKGGDAQVMVKRIERAAHVVCLPEPDANDQASSAEWQACFNKAVNGALDRLASPTVTAAYQGDGKIFVANRSR